jgi:hypothetical protein
MSTVAINVILIDTLQLAAVLRPLLESVIPKYTAEVALCYHDLFLLDFIVLKVAKLIV